MFRLPFDEVECTILWKQLHPTLPYPTEAWKAFLPSSNGLQTTWSAINSSKVSEEKEYNGQMHWGILALRASLQAALRLQKGVDQTLFQSYSFLAGQRREIAAILDQDPTGKLEIGIPRIDLLDTADMAHTTIDKQGRYADQYPLIRARILSLIEKYKNNPTKTCQVHSEIGRREKSFQECYFYRTDAVAISIAKNITSIATLIREFDFDNGFVESIKISHPSICAEAEGILDTFGIFLNSPEQITLAKKILLWPINTYPVEFYHYLGALASTLGPCVPLSTGSASTSDFLLKTLLLLKRFLPQPFKNCVNWDIWSMLSPDPYEFAADYYHMHQSTPWTSQSEKFIIQAPKKKPSFWCKRKEPLSSFKEIQADFLTGIPGDIKEFDHFPHTYNLMLFAPSTFGDNDGTYPLFPHRFSFSEEKEPCFLYKDYQRILLNRMGRVGFKHYCNVFQKMCIHIFEKEKRFSAEIIAHLIKPGGFFSIYCFFGDYSLKLNKNTISDFTYYLKMNAPRLEEVRLNFLMYEAVMDCLDEGPKPIQQEFARLMKDIFGNWEYRLHAILKSEIYNTFIKPRLPSYQDHFIEYFKPVVAPGLRSP